MVPNKHWAGAHAMELPSCWRKANCPGRKNSGKAEEGLQVLPNMKSLLSGLGMRGGVCAEDGES